MDSVVMRLADKKRFPKLKTIVLAGHSAGGQYMQRYTAGSLVPSVVQAKRQMQFRFIVSNPSSYAYLDDHRPMFASADSAGNVSTFPHPADTSSAGDFNEYRRWRPHCRLHCSPQPADILHLTRAVLAHPIWASFHSSPIAPAITESLCNRCEVLLARAATTQDKIQKRDTKTGNRITREALVETYWRILRACIVSP